jgi:hypothetical protein
VLKFKRVLIAGALAFVMGSAQAALIDRGGGLLYDNVLNVTWLQDANFAKTSGYDADGLMSWNAANSWANNLVFHDSVRNADYSDWRLPTVSPVNSQKGWDYSAGYDGISSDRSYNITSPSSELSFMYYVNLGLKGELSPSGVFQADFGGLGIGSYAWGGQADVGLVRNFQNTVYWTGTEVGRNELVAPSSDYAWWFTSQIGFQTFAVKSQQVAAWAVRSGDVAAIPEPETYAMLLTGLAALAVSMRRRTHKVQAQKLSFPRSFVCQG